MGAPVRWCVHPACALGVREPGKGGCFEEHRVQERQAAETASGQWLLIWQTDQWS
jgi:hypothetical protein